jgi:hypothetical protein
MLVFLLTKSEKKINILCSFTTKKVYTMGIRKCSFDGCFRNAELNGFCKKHALRSGKIRKYKTAKKKQIPKCKFQGCNKNLVVGCRGYCRRHYSLIDKICRESGCDNKKKFGLNGYCQDCADKKGIKGFSCKRCQEINCNRFSQSGYGGYCIKHGKLHGYIGKSKPYSVISKKCQETGCLKVVQRGCGGYCIFHAKMNKVEIDPSVFCKKDGCGKYARSGKEGYCQNHYKERKNDK